MSDKLSHRLAVKKPLSKIYLALFSAPLMLLGSADIVRADDAIFDGELHITGPANYAGDVYVGRNQSGNVLIDNTVVNAYNIYVGSRYNGQIFDSSVTVRGPNAVLNAINDQFVLHGGLKLGQGTLRVEDGALVSAEDITVGTTQGYDSHLDVKGAGSRVISENLRIGPWQGARSTLLIENGGEVATTVDATIDNGFTAGETDKLSPKATVTGNNSLWNVTRSLTVSGDLDVLNGGAVNAGSAEIAGVSGTKKTAELYIAGNGSRFTSASNVSVGTGVVSVVDGGTFSAGSNELQLGNAGFNADRGALIIGSRGNMDTGTGLTEPTLGAAGGAGTVDAQTVVNLRGGLFSSYVYFNHNSDNYDFRNKMVGDGEVINTAGQTTLSGDLAQLKANVTARGGKIIIASDINTQKEDDLFDVQTLVAENGGTLILNGTAGSDVANGMGYSSAALIRSGGTLGGNGTLGQTEVQSGGHISPGDGNIGTLTLKRYLNFLGESFYDVDIAGDGSSDKLVVAGKTTISEQAKVHVTALDPQTSYQTGQSYRILTSEGGIDGQFAEAISESAFLDVALNHSTNAVDLTIAQKGSEGVTPGEGSNPDESGNPGEGSNPDESGNSGGGSNPGEESTKPGIFQTVAQTSNQWNTAGALSTLAQQGSSLALYNSLLSLNTPQAREAFNQLSGEIYPSIQSNLIASSNMLSTTLNQRMLHVFDNDALPVPPLAMTLVQPAPVENNGIWGQTFGSWARNSDNGNVGKLDGNTSGFLLGADRKLADHSIRVGGYWGYSRGDYNVDSRRSTSDSDNYHLGLYAAGQQDAFSLRGAMGYTWHRLDGERSVNFGNFSDRITSNYNANSLLAYTEAGYRFGQLDTNVEPFVNLSYIRLHTDGFQENGGAAALNVRDETMNTFYSTLGVHGATELPKNVSLYGSLGWRHAYGDKTTSSQMAFAGSNAFITQGQSVDDNLLVADVRVSMNLSRSTTFDLGYQGQYGSDTQVNAVNANIRWSF